ncbi:GMC family oxidoreductase N-terminal domain-containing protein [Bradyrhizobium sp. 190]|uniref:GMC family oxidoreductase n=1 Tax=Bradyrhizobium sp. 190 TaxID=2782658 RepID=UPI001FF8552E|nr:GMC family oxidoreductase N-terminal domain-containing protein [Bradyrhizobium sp. 190]MCK1516968.1 GMC family oxidoreductase N-terminal domain-containing protein [Bradyrhizobium sp. 190]
MQFEFDYIVVGSGSAGSVVASRLSDDTNLSVLLVEAGGSDKSLKVVMPGLVSSLFGDPNYDWCFTAEPDRTRAGQCDYMPRGKVLGGTSSINAMCFLRGSAEDFEAWASLGNEGWDYRSVLPYFRTSERFEGGGSPTRGDRGFQPVSFLRSAHPMSKIFLEACVRHGAKHISDLNNGEYEGVGFAQVSQLRGSRYSAARSYVWPARKRRNFRLLLHTQVQRVLFENRKATGIEVVRGNDRTAFKARRGVVLSGGVFGTPHILMLSGIGPSEQLRRMGIDVLIDAPGVGRNLQDHAGTRHVAWVDIKTLNMVVGPIEKLAAGLQWLFFGKGAAASPMTQVVLARKMDRPDRLSRFQVLFTPGAYEMSLNGAQSLDRPAVMAIVNVHRPYSSGYLELDSPDFREPLKIHPDLFADERDLDTLIAGHRIVREIFHTAPLRNHVVGEYKPGPSLQSDDELKTFIKETARGIYHPAGTCKMGAGPSSVVDSRLAVRGVQNLYIADASVMPFVVSSNLNATCMMVGERLAEWLKAA